jgi:hypothetical protein
VTEVPEGWDYKFHLILMNWNLDHLPLASGCFGSRRAFVHRIILIDV